MDEGLEGALERAVARAPDDVELRVHFGRMLLQSGQSERAVEQAVAALELDSGSDSARLLMNEATAAFDWAAAEEQVGDIAAQNQSRFRIEAPTTTLEDVGGMTSVKSRLNASFLGPLRNPELRKLYSKSLRGGLLMYGPPGCGKTYIARALAGELGVNFLAASLADVLGPYIGQNEGNVHELFKLARAQAPVVLFLDELDALGHKRSALAGSAGRGTVNQLLTELDGVATDNEGVFILAATNQPWDVDPALRRPGRLDRTVIVLPPDIGAREAIFRQNLNARPVEALQLNTLAKMTEGYSGADITYVCEVASERALADSVETGTTRLISMADLRAAIDEVPPSTRPWMRAARNVVMFGEDDGTFRELRAYLKKVKEL